MKRFRSADQRVVVLVLPALLTVIVAGAPPSVGSSSAADTGSHAPGAVDSAVYKDASENEVIDKKHRSISTRHDAEVDNRIPIIYSDGSDSERTVSSDGFVTGSGELKSTAAHAQSEITSGEANVKTAPKYMLDLYDKFSKDKYSHPMANIVRSFTNINSETETSSSGGASGNSTREHRLVFNVTSVGRNEDIYLAELRLLTLVETDRSLYDGVNRRVTIYELRTLSGNFTSDYVPIASKLIYGRSSGWETFTVTNAVKHWVALRSTTQVVVVRINSVEQRRDADDDVTGDHDDQYSEVEPDIDIATRAHSDSEPLLLVFSNDRRHRRFDSRELHEIIGHEMQLYEHEDLPAAAAVDTDDGGADYSDEYEYYDYDEAVDADAEHVVSRVERDTAAVADSQSPSPDREIASSRRDAGRQTSAAAKLRVRRAKLRRRRRNICRRKPMYVDFQDLHWDGWVIEPKGYQAYECSGRCYFPLSDHLTPTKHAIVQTMLNAYYPRKAGRACCVPTRLDPISILYVDDQGTVTYKYKYDGMVVAECGCR